MRRSLITVLALLMVSSCTGDEGAETFIRVNVDGALWSAPAGDAQLAYTVDNPDDSGYYVSVAAQTRGSMQQLFSLGLPDPVVEGSYALNGLGTWAAYASCPTNTDFGDCAYWTVVPEDPGTLTITAVDGTTDIVTGTFSLNGHFLGESDGAVKPLTSGAFAIRVPGVGGPVIASPR